MADINGDGLKDIVGFGLYNQQIAFADGNGGFLAPITVGAGLGGTGNLLFFLILLDFFLILRLEL